MKSITKIKNILRSVMLVPSLVLGIGLVAPVAVHADCPENGAVTGNISSGASCAQPGGQAGKTTLFGKNSIFTTVTNLLLFIIGAIAVIMLIIGGIRYVLSGGEQSSVTSAKNTILYAIIGIVVAFLAYAAVQFVTGQLEKTPAGGAGGATGYVQDTSNVA